MKLIDKIEFDALSNAEKRVAICQDVIARINVKSTIPDSGSFMKTFIPSNDLDSLKDAINTINCRVCAKGALFCSWVGNFNGVSISRYREVEPLEEVEYMQDVSPELVEVFGRVMLDNIEAAFEEDTYIWHYDEHETAKYMYAFRDYDLTNIMEYIIEHKGEFPLPVSVGA